jgi:HK97 family phage major capsid protein
MTQAKALYEQGVKDYEELRADLAALDKKNSDGELTDEAYAAESAALHAKEQKWEALIARAERLGKLEDGRDKLEELSRQADRPSYQRAMSDGQPIAAALGAQGRDSGGCQLSWDDRVALSRLSGIAPPDVQLLAGEDRALVNAYFRTRNAQQRGSMTAGLSDAQMARLRRGSSAVSLDQAVTEELNAGGVRLTELNANPYIDHEGGALVATEVRSEVLLQLRDRRYIRERAYVIATNAAEVTIPSFKIVKSMHKTRAHKGRVDGVTAPEDVREWLGREKFSPHGKMIMIQIPEELLEDTSFDIVGFIASQIAEQAFDDEEQLFLTGTGRNEPFGVLTAGVDGFQHTGSGGAAFKPEDIKTLPFKMRAVHLNGAIWMANRKFYEQIAVMRSDSGTGTGTGNFLFQMGLALGDPATLGGYEAVSSEFFPDNISAGSAGDPLCLFGNWNNYWIVERKAMDLRVLQELYAATNQIGYRFNKRLDGAPVRRESWVTLDRKA